MTANEFISRLTGVKGNSGQWYAKCPAHDDNHESLSVSIGKDGRILLKCHAGCTVDAIAAAMGLTVKDLFVDKTTPKTKPTITEIYTYPNGAQKVRYSDKHFGWRQPDGKGGWTWNRKGLSRTLYIAGELCKSMAIAEGEKDADTLHKLGYDACSAEDGAGAGKWLKEYTEQLTGAHVIIFQDNDDKGKAFAQETAAALHGNAASVKVIDLASVWPEIPVKADVTDMVDCFGIERAGELVYQAINMAKEWIATDRPAQMGKTLTVETTEAALNELGISVRNNQLTKELEATGLPNYYSKENALTVLPVYLMDYLKAKGVKGITRQGLCDCLACVADKNRYNPIKEFLLSGSWDGVDRMPELYQILGVTDAMHQTYIRKWFLQCVALGLNTENKPVAADGVLVLQGAQGLAKTSFFRIMSPFDRAFVEGAVIDMRIKDTLIAATKGWITELGELDSTLKKEQMSLKAFVTLPEDNIRLPYARTETRSPRRTSFCGTVNPEDYLKDETGSRRFWTVPVTAIDKKKLFTLPRSWVNQVWYQTYHAYLNDPNGYRLTDAELQKLQTLNQQFEQSLKGEEEILALLDFDLPFEQWEWWSAVEINNRAGLQIDARSTGKALKKVVQALLSESTIFESTSTTQEKITRISRGLTQYYIPLKRYHPNSP